MPFNQTGRQLHSSMRAFGMITRPPGCYQARFRFEIVHFAGQMRLKELNLVCDPRIDKRLLAVAVGPDLA